MIEGIAEAAVTTAKAVAATGPEIAKPAAEDGLVLANQLESGVKSGGKARSLLKSIFGFGSKDQKAEVETPNVQDQDEEIPVGENADAEPEKPLTMQEQIADLQKQMKLTRDELMRMRTEMNTNTDALKSAGAVQTAKTREEVRTSSAGVSERVKEEGVATREAVRQVKKAA